MLLYDRRVMFKLSADVSSVTGPSGAVFTPSIAVSQKLKMFAGSGRSFRAYCFKRIGDCAAHFDAADAASLPCAQPDLVVEDSCARRAVLSDLQLGRIRRHMQATDTAEPLACQNAAVLRPDARIARRAARTSTSSAVRIIDFDTWPARVTSACLHLFPLQNKRIAHPCFSILYGTKVEDL